MKRSAISGQRSDIPPFEKGGGGGIFLLLASCFLLLASTVFAQPAQKPLHEGAEVETGVITGRLLEKGKTPLEGRQVVLEILSGHNLVLTIPKQTDAKGAYQFKNIFMSPEFSYAISTEFEGKVYRTNFISLAKGEKTKKLDLAVGAGVSEGPPLPPPMEGDSPLSGGGLSPFSGARTHERTNALSEYQLLAIMLAIAAIGCAIWQRRKK